MDQPQLRARLVLSDAYEAAERTNRDLDAGKSWRINWIAAVALLRAVGHVLLYVDKKEQWAVDAVVAAEARWRTKPVRDAIYWDFIKKERDNVLKSYLIGTTAPAYLLTEEGGRILLEDGSALLLEHPNMDRMDEALAWWEAELAAIEAEIQKAG